MLAVARALVLLALPFAVQAQDTTKTKADRWRRIAISGGDTTLIDTQSIVQGPTGDEVSVWVDTRSKESQTSAIGRKYTRALIRTAFDCRARTARLDSWTTFKRDGSVASAGDHPPYPLSDPFAVRPGSVGEQILETVCSPSDEQPQKQGANYPPTPTKMFIPPLPMPDRVRGFHLVAEYEVDETGKVVDFKFTPTPDAAYNKRLEEALKGFAFRPGTRADGQPVRMSTSIIYDF